MRRNRVSFVKTSLLTLLAAAIVWPMVTFVQLREGVITDETVWTLEFLTFLRLAYLFAVWPNYRAYQASARLLERALKRDARSL
jgi:hypothetical protein